MQDTIESTQQRPAIPMQTLLFNEHAQLTGVTEYGISWEEFSRGDSVLPAQGARFDISFEGTLEGPAIKGSIRGTDFLEVRADGKFMLNIQATITTHDGEKIALHEDGILLPAGHTGAPANLRLNMRFATASPRYAWLNNYLAWGIGNVHMHQGKVEVSAFIA